MLNSRLVILKLPKLFNPLDKFIAYFSHDVGIDLGTANTLVWVKNRGVVIREPSVVARQRKTKEILAIGTAAKKMLGKTPQTIEVIRPLKDGVIADFDAAEAILKHYIKKVHSEESTGPKIPRPRVVIGIPSGVTEVERRAVADVAVSSGARKVYLIEEPIAAALGAGLPIEGSEGVFVVDIGGGTTEIAIISLGGIVLGRSIRVAGDEMNEAIMNYIRLKYSLLLGEASAEEVKISLGAASLGGKKSHVVRGRDLETGLPRSVKIESSEIAEALLPIIQEIIAVIVELVEETPPELMGDILDRGIVMAGGGSLLSGIDRLISDKVKIPVSIADDPLTCVVRGCGQVLEDERLLAKIKVTKGL